LEAQGRIEPAPRDGGEELAAKGGIRWHLFGDIKCVLLTLIPCHGTFSPPRTALVRRAFSFRF